MSEAETALAEPAGDAPAEAPAAPAAEEPPKGNAKGAKEKPPKDKKGKEKEAAEALPDGPSIAGHPRAVRSVARAKGWGAVVGFTLGGYLSLPTHTLADAGLRALAGGAILYMAAWGGAVFAWRRLVMIEIKAREAALIAAARAARERQAPGAGPAGQGVARGR